MSLKQESLCKGGILRVVKRDGSRVSAAAKKEDIIDKRHDSTKRSVAKKIGSSLKKV